MKYGDLPKSLGIHEAKCSEMLFYQYLPIKLAGAIVPVFEERIIPFSNLIGVCNCDYIADYGLSSYVNSHIYLTVKHMYVSPNCSFNRPGWHSDGFMSNDINYVWCDKYPTTFNSSCFELTEDHDLSLVEMESQALPVNDVLYNEMELLRLDQYNIHKVSEVEKPGMRTFFKLSFSSDMYNLIGNSKNYLIDYDWDMKQRKEERNAPSY